MGEIRELLVLALSLVWFAGATPEMKFAKLFTFYCSFWPFLWFGLLGNS